MILCPAKKPACRVRIRIFGMRRSIAENSTFCQETAVPVLTVRLSINPQYCLQFFLTIPTILPTG